MYHFGDLLVLDFEIIIFWREVIFQVLVADDEYSCRGIHSFDFGIIGEVFDLISQVSLELRVPGEEALRQSLGG